MEGEKIQKFIEENPTKEIEIAISFDNGKVKSSISLGQFKEFYDKFGLNVLSETTVSLTEEVIKQMMKEDENNT